MVNLSDIIDDIMAIVPADLEYLKKDFSEHLKVTLENKLNDMKIVTQEEFDIQKKVLLKTRKKLDKLEKIIQELDSK